MTPAIIDMSLRVVDEEDLQLAIHTDTLNEAGFVEDRRWRCARSGSAAVWRREVRDRRASLCGVPCPWNGATTH